MRLSFLTIIFCMVFSQITYGQVNKDAINLNKLKAPSSPSAVIIDNQIGAINSPKSWSALEASVFSNFVNNEGSILLPENYSLEFSPYWAKDNLKLSNEEFLTPNIASTLKQNFSFSISSTQSFLLEDSVKSNTLGFGIRTMLWQGTKAEKNLVLKCYGKLVDNLKASTRVFNIADNLDCTDCNVKKMISIFIDKIETEKNDIFSESLPDKVKNNIIKEFELFLSEKVNTTEGFADSISDVFDEFIKLDEQVSEIEIYIADRKGFKLEIASALSLNFPTNEIDFSVFTKFGVWITPSYQPFRHDFIEFIGVIRYFNYNLGFYENYIPSKIVYDDSIDIGARIVLKWKKYSIEFEGVGRSSRTVISDEVDEIGFAAIKSKKESDFQYVLNFNYQINDNILLSYNFGKQFDPVLNYNGNLISLLSLNFALNSPKKDVLK